jgi:transposase
MSRLFLTHSPDQQYLLPASPTDWLPSDHLCYWVVDLLSSLDMSGFYKSYSSDGRGAPAYDPRMLAAVVLYAWLRGVFSSRKIARLCREDLGVRVIVGEHQPDFRTFISFRNRHGDVLSSLFQKSVCLCQEAGLVSLLEVAGDGTKIAANANKDQSVTYAKASRQEAQISAAIDELMARSAAEDAAEDALYGPDQPEPSPVPAELAGHQARRDKLREAQKALKARAAAQAVAYKERHENQPPEHRSHRKPLADPDQAEPKEDQQYNFVDPDSRIMKRQDGTYIQGYNAQALVDGEHQIIVGSLLSNEPNDIQQLCPLIDNCIELTGVVPGRVLADKGYHSLYNLEQIRDRGITPCIPPHSRYKTGHLTPDERETYKRRSAIVEPVFGQLKGNGLMMGFWRFYRRGMPKCRQDWSLLCAVHNFRQLFTLAPAITA